MKQYPFLDMKLANLPLEEDLKKAACAVIASGRYLHGEQTHLLEEEIARTCQVQHCIAVSNGLDALKLILRAYREMGIINAGDKVIVPANTYVASVLAVSENDMVPVFCEPREDTMNLDARQLEQLITPQVKAVMPVHLYGTPAWDEQLKNIAQAHGLKIIEDNAQAIGAKTAVAGISGTFTTGGLGDAAGVSFYPTKNLGALGDAGAVTTNDPLLAQAVRALANYGSDTRYHNIYKGFNCRIDEMQAAMLRVKLHHLNSETTRRNAIAKAYSEAITNPLVTLPHTFEGTTQVWHQYIVRVKHRDAFRAYLQQNGIGTDVHYATPPHLQPCYSEYQELPLPVTCRLAQEVVSLPIAHPITPADACYIAQVINNFTL